MSVKAVLIGCSGHMNYIREADHRLFNIVAYAPGVVGEDLSPLHEDDLLKDAQYFQDWSELLDLPGVELLINNTWYGMAGKITLAALKKGLSVFAEKPLCSTLKELNEIHEVWKRAEVSLGGMFGISYEGQFLKAAEYLKNPGIGSIRLIHAQKSYKLGSRPEFYKNRESSTGLIPWVGSHGFDWILRFCDQKVLAVTAYHSNQYNNDHVDLESSAACLLKMENGIAATLNIDYLRPQGGVNHGDDRIRLVGSEGILEIREGMLTLIDKRGSRTLTPLSDLSVFNEFLKSLDHPEHAIIWGRHLIQVTHLSLLARQSADEELQIPVQLYE